LLVPLAFVTSRERITPAESSQTIEKMPVEWIGWLLVFNRKIEVGEIKLRDKSDLGRGGDIGKQQLVQREPNWFSSVTSRPVTMLEFARFAFASTNPTPREGQQR